MEKERILEPELDGRSIDEPHFDEEWTVLSARPVVPLNGVAGTDRIRGALKLAAAFVGASLLGVVVALASIRWRETSPSVTQAEVPAQSDPAQNGSGDASAMQQTAVAPEAEAAPVLPKTSSQVTESTKRRSVQLDASSETEKQSASGSANGQPAKLVDQWQEQRPRRTTFRRQRRDKDDLHHRDLLRIQEIFEGRRP